MSDELGNLGGLDAAVQRDVQVIRHFGRVVARDQRRERHDAAVARRKAGTFPNLAEQAFLGVLLQRGGYRSYVLGLRCPGAYGGERKGGMDEFYYQLLHLPYCSSVTFS